MQCVFPSMQPPIYLSKWPFSRYLWNDSGPKACGQGPVEEDDGFRGDPPVVMQQVLKDRSDLGTPGDTWNRLTWWCHLWFFDIFGLFNAVYFLYHFLPFLSAHAMLVRLRTDDPDSFEGIRARQQAVPCSARDCDVFWPSHLLNVWPFDQCCGFNSHKNLWFVLIGKGHSGAISVCLCSDFPKNTCRLSWKAMNKLL